MIPPFLKPILESRAGPRSTTFLDATFTHSQKLGESEAHCLWWPCKNTNVDQNTVLVFVPGNPGLADFYIPYLSYIHETAPDSLAILAHSLLGHSPRVSAVSVPYSSLEAQVEGVIEVVDQFNAVFGSPRIVLIGHSVGSWIVLQTLKERSDRITAVFLLFPTIAHIARTPNGSRLSWLFSGPLPRILATLSSCLQIIPKRLLALLFSDWPAGQLEVLWSFLSHPPAIFASLSLAHQEMVTIKDLDKHLLDKIKHKLYFFLAEKDDWVGTNKQTILSTMDDEPHAVRVVHGRHGVPHAYCINHSRELGEQTLTWLQDDVLGLPSDADEVHHRRSDDNIVFLSYTISH